MNEIRDQFVWFEGLLLLIAKNQHSLENNLGLKLRVYGGAALSITDGMTDVFVTVTYWGDETTRGAAQGILLCLVFNFLVQSVVVFIQNRKLPPAQQIREQIHLFTLLKPAVDAYRVATGIDESTRIMSPMTELMFCKGIELATEAVPGSVFQVGVGWRG